MAFSEVPYASPRGASGLLAFSLASTPGTLDWQYTIVWNKFATSCFCQGLLRKQSPRIPSRESTKIQGSRQNDVLNEENLSNTCIYNLYVHGVIGGTKFSVAQSMQNNTFVV